MYAFVLVHLTLNIIFSVAYLVPFPCSLTSTSWIYTTKTRVAFASPWWSICKNQIQIRTNRWFSYGYHKCMFVDFFIGYVGPPNCVHCWVWRSWLILGNVIQSLLDVKCLYDVCSLIRTELHTNRIHGSDQENQSLQTPSSSIGCWKLWEVWHSILDMPYFTTPFTRLLPNIYLAT